MEYRELVLRIVAIGDDGYRIVAECDLLRAPAEEPFEPPWTLEELGRVEGKVSEAVRGELRDAGAKDESSSRAETPSSRAAGLELSRSALTGKVEAALERALEEAAAIGAGLRIRIVFPLGLTPERLALLTSLPWEMLWLTRRQRYLGRSSRTPIVRDFEQGERVEPLPRRLPLGILVVDSGATDLPLQKESRRLREALGDRRLFAPYYLERPDISQVRHELQACDIQVLHLMGHGGYNDHSGRGGIQFIGSGGGRTTILGEKLAEFLADLPGLRLVVLNTCNSGMMRGPEGLAAALLMRESPPAVVAMQQPITNGAAERFSSALYGKLAAGVPVDAALSEARLALSSRGSEWATPVLYLPSSDGRLFSLEGVEPKPLSGAVPLDEVNDTPLHLAVHSRGDFGALDRYDAGRRLELGDRFDPRESPYIADGKSWHDDLFVPLEEFLLDAAGEERPLLLDTAMHQSLAFAAGRVLHTKTSVPIVFRQRTQGQDDYRDWDLADRSEQEEASWLDEWSLLDSNRSDVALAVSVRKKVEPDVREYLAQSGLAVRQILHARVPKPGPRSVAGGAHCLQLAWDLDELLHERTQEERKGTLHVFGAAPNAFWFAFGQLSRGFGRFQLYEYDFDSPEQFGKYVPSLSF